MMEPLDVIVGVVRWLKSIPTWAGHSGMLRGQESRPMVPGTRACPKDSRG